MLPMNRDQRAAATAHPPMGRGRPASRAQRTVADDIVQAALDSLKTCSPQQLTVKEIAARAGTRPAMVSYYYGGLEGLLDEIVRSGIKAVCAETMRLRDAVLRNAVTNPLREMIAAFAAAYNRHPALTRILISEILRAESSIRDYFVSQSPAYGKKIMEDVLAHLAASGYYRPDIDVERIGTMIRSVVFYPVIIKPYLARESESIQHYLDGAWIDFVTEVFECYLKPARCGPPTTTNDNTREKAG